MSAEQQVSGPSTYIVPQYQACYQVVVTSIVSSVHSLLSLTVPVPPSPPRNVFIQSMDIGATFARICWQPPTSEGIPTVSRYVITVTQVNSTAQPLTLNTTDATEDFNVTGLAPGTTYEFRVSAISESGMVVGQSGLSEPFTAATNFTGMWKCVCVCVCVIIMYNMYI